MKLKDIISLIYAYDDISVQDTNGRIYNGECQDFRATCEWAYEVLDSTVNGIRSDNDVTIIFINA